MTSCSSRPRYRQGGMGQAAKKLLSDCRNWLVRALFIAPLTTDPQADRLWDLSDPHCKLCSSFTKGNGRTLGKARRVGCGPANAQDIAAKPRYECIEDVTYPSLTHLGS